MGILLHLESRTSRTPGSQFDILIKVKTSRSDLLILIKALRQSQAIATVSVLPTQGTISGRRIFKELKKYVYLECFFLYFQLLGFRNTFPSWICAII